MFVYFLHLYLVYFQVNGHSLVGADHHRAVEVLKLAGNSVVMIVARETLAPVIKPETEPQNVEEVDGGMKIYAQVYSYIFYSKSIIEKIPLVISFLKSSTIA